MIMNNRLMAICGLVVALAAGWTWWWHSIADHIEQEVTAYLATEDQVQVDNFDITGFPFRMQLALNKVSLTAPDHPLKPRLAFETLHAVMQPWNLVHVLFFTDGPYSLTVAGDTRILNEEISHASLRLKDWQPVQFSAEIGNLTSDRGESIEKLELHLRQVDGAAHQDIYLIGQNMVLDGIDGRIDQVAIDAAFSPALTQDWSEENVIAWLKAGGKTDIRKLHAHWAGIDLRAHGDLSLDDRFRPMGLLTADIRGQNALLDRLVRQGFLKEGDRLIAQLAMSALSNQDATGTKVLTVPIEAKEGILSLGPLRLWGLQPLF